jgi:hypothetical protein
MGRVRPVSFVRELQSDPLIHAKEDSAIDTSERV